MLDKITITEKDKDRWNPKFLHHNTGNNTYSSYSIERWNGKTKFTVDDYEYNENEFCFDLINTSDRIFDCSPMELVRKIEKKFKHAKENNNKFALSDVLDEKNIV